MQDRHRDELPLNRRVFLKSGIIFSGVALAGSGLLRGAETEKKGDEQEAEVGPPGDLMREHGVLKRVLLIYGEALRQLDAKQDFPPEALADAAGIIRYFVEDYHEKLEEDFLFPRFEKANQLVDLVKVLRTQHQARRRVTDVTMRFANLQSLRMSPSDCSSSTRCSNLFACTIHTKPARTLFSFLLFERSFRRMNSILWARISRRRKTSSLVKTDLRRRWIRWPESRSDSASTISPNLRRRFSLPCAAFFLRMHPRRRFSCEF